MLNRIPRSISRTCLIPGQNTKDLVPRLNRYTHSKPLFLPLPHKIAQVKLSIPATNLDDSIAQIIQHYFQRGYWFIPSSYSNMDDVNRLFRAGMEFGLPIEKLHVNGKRVADMFTELSARKCPIVKMSQLLSSNGYSSLTVEKLNDLERKQANIELRFQNSKFSDKPSVTINASRLLLLPNSKVARILYDHIESDTIGLATRSLGTSIVQAAKCGKRAPWGACWLPPNFATSLDHEFGPANFNFGKLLPEYSDTYIYPGLKEIANKGEFQADIILAKTKIPGEPKVVVVPEDVYKFYAQLEKDTPKRVLQETLAFLKDSYGCTASIKTEKLDSQNVVRISANWFNNHLNVALDMDLNAQARTAVAIRMSAFVEQYLAPIVEQAIGKGIGKAVVSILPHGVNSVPESDTSFNRNILQSELPQTYYNMLCKLPKNDGTESTFDCRIRESYIRQLINAKYEKMVAMTINVKELNVYDEMKKANVKKAMPTFSFVLFK